MIGGGTSLISWTIRWVLPLVFIAILVFVWNVQSMSMDDIKGMRVFRIGNGTRPADLSDHQALTYKYQSRVDQIGWLKGQCKRCRSIIDANQTVFPYLQIPPLLEEYAEQFHQPLKARIAVLHVWSSSESLPPPFFQYWLASALANYQIADFLLFVPDNATAALLQRLMPVVTAASASSNVRLHIVGDFQDFLESRIGQCLEESEYNISGATIARLKPMFGYVFQDYIDEYSHWAWADMDLIFGNLTKFLGRPLAEGYDIISMSAVEWSKKKARWRTHICCCETALAGQLTVLANTNETRNYFRQSDLSDLDQMRNYDERVFPWLLKERGIRIAHVFAQGTDQFKSLDNSHFDWSPRGLYKMGDDDGCYEYEVGVVHMMKGKNLVNSHPRVAVKPESQGSADQIGTKTLEETIFPGPLVWETLSGFAMNFPVTSSAPWQPYDAPTNNIICASVRGRMTH